MATRKPKKQAKSKSGASKKRGARSKASNRSPVTDVAPFRFAATLTIAAIFVWGLYTLAKQETPRQQPNTQTTADIQPEKTAKKSDSVETGDNYTFYKTLKDFRIDVPDALPNGKKSQLEKVSYVIQAGSFKTSGQAEQLRAEMILLGLEPRVEKNRNTRNEMWYRVMLGPYTSRSTMANVRATLIENRIDAMVMQRKG